MQIGSVTITPNTNDSDAGVTVALINDPRAINSVINDSWRLFQIKGILWKIGQLF